MWFIRLVPRTRQTERIRTRIIHQRANNDNSDREVANLPAEESNQPGPSTSSRRTTARATTTKKKSVKKRTRKCKKSRRKPRYKIIYEIDDTTGEKIALKKKIVRRYRRKKKSKKRKVKVRRVVVPKSVKNRLARQLGICPPNRKGQTLPDMKVLSL